MDWKHPFSRKKKDKVKAKWPHNFIACLYLQAKWPLSMNHISLGMKSQNHCYQNLT
jgi:hypothetical protein